MRRLTLIVLLGLIALPFLAEPVPADWRIAFRAGAMMNDGKVDVVSPDRGPVLGAEAAVTFHPQWLSLQQWRNAGVGVALAYYNLGDDVMLGNAIAPYAFVETPLVNRPHFIFGLRLGLGFGLLTRTYRNTVPEGHLFTDVTNANQCIGSVFNFHFPEALYFEFPIKDGWSLAAEGGWYHFSNGSTVQPNSGYNIFSAALSTRYTPPTVHRASCTVNPEPKDSTRHFPFTFLLATTFGGRQVYYRDQASFFCFEVQAAAYWLAHPVFRLGAGVDVFYDGSYVPRDTHFAKTNLAAANPDGKDCWRLGVSLQPEIILGHMTCGFHIGMYVWDPVRHLEPYDEAIQSPTGRLDKPVLYTYDILKAGTAGHEDGWLYTQLVLRYHLPWHVFIQANMKAHLTKVEFLSFGLGAYL